MKEGWRGKDTARMGELEIVKRLHWKLLIYMFGFWGQFWKCLETGVGAEHGKGLLLLSLETVHYFCPRGSF